ncbi:MAG: DNA polymerase III subunit beta [Patescibacteria group bacterium]
MKFKILKERLKEIVYTVERICSKKGDLNILNFFQIKANNNKIFVSATDLEISYQAEIFGKIEQEGEVLLPSKQFVQLLDSFYEDELTLEKNGNSVRIKGDNSVSNLVGLIEEEYPVISAVEKNKYFEVDSGIFEDSLNKVFSNLRTADLFKPELSGVYFILTKKDLTLVTTDTLRLSETKIKSQFYTSNIDDTKILIPKKIIQEYLAIKRKPTKLSIFFEEHQISFDLGSQVLITKLMSAEFPDYKRIIPEEFNLSIHIEKDSILKILKLNKVFLDQTKEVRFKINPTQKQAEIYSKNELLGETTNNLKINIIENVLRENEIFEIGFNHEFFQDGILAVEGEKIFLGFNQSNGETSKPLVIKSPIEEDFIYILMPL